MSDTTRLAEQTATARTSGECLMGMPDSSWCGNCHCGAREPLPDVPLVAGELIVDTRPQSAHFAGRCRCRPGCLSLIDPGDLIVHCAGGWMLAAHAADDVPLADFALHLQGEPA